MDCKQTIELYQIFYNDETRAAVRPELIPLDNCEGPHGWFEFWPILNFLRENELSENVWYGFFSPKFPEKARVSLEEVFSLVSKNPCAEVALVSYRWKLLATQLNPWLSGERNHPGLLRCSERFLSSIGHRLDLETTVCDFTTSSFSNYVIAKKAYWVAWKEIAEEYLRYVESGGASLADNHMTPYKESSDTPLRAFVQERFLSVVLLSNEFRTVHIDYVSLLGRGPGGRRFPGLLKLAFRSCDLAKRLARRTGVRSFLYLHTLFQWLIRRFSGDGP